MSSRGTSPGAPLPEGPRPAGSAGESVGRGPLPPVDRFVVEAIAGEGAMGVVYRARDRDTGELVALKISVADVTDRQRADDRFLREAVILARLGHPNIVRYVGHGISETGVY